MVITASDRQWYKQADWEKYLELSEDNDHWQRSNADHYAYIKGVERIRDLTDSEFCFARAYDRIVLGVVGK